MSTAEPVVLLLTAEQAAQVLNLKPYQVEKFRREGRLKARRTGGTEQYPRGFRYLLSDLEAFVRSCPTTAEPAEGGAA